MTVIETVRPGVQFIPDAAAAFRRADAQVRAEFGRGIDVNSTYRSWSDQMVMFINWGRYVAGKGPHPGHSKAVHPSESFHVAGIALDSDDWRIPRIVAILAENGFIRNRLHVPNENHHFEWLRNHDQNYGKPIPGSAASAPPVPEEDEDMKIIRWAANGACWLMTDESTDYIATGPELAALVDIWGQPKTVENAALSTIVSSLKVPWAAMEATFRSQAFDNESRFGRGTSWTRTMAEAQRQTQFDASLARSIDDLEKAIGDAKTAG